MPVCIWFCLCFGSVLSIAGTVFAGAGLSLCERTFDTGLFTPGVVAAVGGLLLIGLSLALRDRTGARGADHAARSATPIAAAADTLDESGVGAAFALPSQMKQAPAAVAEDTSDYEPAYTVAGKAPDTARVGHRSYPPLTQPAASASGEANAEVDADHFGRPGNGAAARRIPPRLPIGARTTPTTERSKSSALDSTWPKGSRPVRGTGAPAHEQAADDASAQNIAQNAAQSPMQNLASSRAP